MDAALRLAVADGSIIIKREMVSILVLVDAALRPAGLTVFGCYGSFQSLF